MLTIHQRLSLVRCTTVLHTTEQKSILLINGKRPSPVRPISIPGTLNVWLRIDGIGYWFISHSSHFTEENMRLREKGFVWSVWPARSWNRMRMPQYHFWWVLRWSPETIIGPRVHKGGFPAITGWLWVLRDSQLVLHSRMHPVEWNPFLFIGSMFLLKILTSRAFVVWFYIQNIIFFLFRKVLSEIESQMAQCQLFCPWLLLMGIRRKAAAPSSLRLVSSVMNGRINWIAELYHPGQWFSAHTSHQNHLGVLE